jgi:hypothetical protein
MKLRVGLAAWAVLLGGGCSAVGDQADDGGAGGTPASGGRGGAAIATTGSGGAAGSGGGIAYDETGRQCDPAAPDGTGGAAATPSAGCSGIPPRMPVKRFIFSGAAGPDGRIYLFGGQSSGPHPCRGPLLVYDPSDGSYRTLASAPGAVLGIPSVVFANGNLIAYDRKLWLYDPMTDRWRDGAPPDAAMINRAATVGPDGRVYFLGGSAWESEAGSDRADAYDPVADQWTSLAPMPFMMGSGSAAATAGRIYVFETHSAVYDPTVARWSQLPSPPTPRYWTSAALDGAGHVAVLGGLIPNGSADGVVEIFDPDTGAWTAGARMAVPAIEFAVASACGGRIFAFGGDGGELFDLVQVYGPGNSWVLSP